MYDQWITLGNTLIKCIVTCLQVATRSITMTGLTELSNNAANIVHSIDARIHNKLIASGVDLSDMVAVYRVYAEVVEELTKESVSMVRSDV